MGPKGPNRTGPEPRQTCGDLAPGQPGQMSHGQLGTQASVLPGHLYPGILALGKKRPGTGSEHPGVLGTLAPALQHLPRLGHEDEKLNEKPNMLKSILLEVKKTCVPFIPIIV